ncbi:hypothetical protein ORD22_03065 [Sporosarcina sp. GW1-11]|uniref:hypothetical protein n=1 Tax=Sporosarcina sp. GW1-11 TaxID=2899126 RepID=UPI00294F2425|nr:hypothetical protein [Sporosarcina sp. GW1-11]MDV6377240.1 hypothetical protein [Sporosarcina sp. GW1-11]
MLSDEQLQKLIEGKMVGDAFPYDTGDELEVESHIRRLFHRINRLPNVVCKAEWNHFGSGYASFIEFFCYRKEDVMVVEEKYGFQDVEIKGILIDISRLAPVAILGEDERYKKVCIETNEAVSGGHGSILDSPHRLTVSEKLQTFADELKNILKDFDYELLEAEHIEQPLSFQTKIPTIYRPVRQYLVMDAIFYWED